MIDGISKEHEKPDRLTSLKSIASELEDILPSEERENLQQTISIADKLLQEIGVNSLDYTKGCLVLAIANNWRRSGTSFTEYQKTSEHLLALFTKKERIYLEPSEPERGAGTTYVIVKSILKELFSERDIDWDALEVPEILKILSVNGIVRLPRNILDENGKAVNPDGLSVYKRAFNENPNIPIRDTPFLALFDSISKVIVIWNDTTSESILHEETHKDNKGMLEGNLGSVLNEGMTELMTLKKIKEKSDEKMMSAYEADSGYIYCIRLIRTLMKKKPGLTEAIWNYFQKNSEKDEKEVANNLIALLNLERYLKLYTAHPTDQIVQDLRYELDPPPKYEKGPLVFEM